MVLRLTPSAPLSRFQLEQAAMQLAGEVLVGAAVSVDFERGSLEIDVTFPGTISWAKLITGTLEIA